MLRPRVSFTADMGRRIIVARYIGDINGKEVVAEILDKLAGVDRLWEFDTIFDLSRHNGLVEVGDNEVLARGWLNLTGGRDAGRRSAVVSPDPLIEARFPLIQAMFPFRTLMLFNSMLAAQAWLEEDRTDAVDAISAA